jgi:hypothetical protein
LTEKKTHSGQAADLRRKAEESVREKDAPSPENIEAMSPEETRQALQKLHVHQIDLEMRNEELCRALPGARWPNGRSPDSFSRKIRPVTSCSINSSWRAG